MANYKVIQDIEAEDKLVGPFSLRQFIYVGIVVVLGLIAFNIAKVNVLVAIPFLPPILFFAALAAPLGGAQSTEVWLLAKIRFMLKPRRRIWSQDGVKDLVTITVPKKEEKQLTDNLTKNEVKSRLSALASTLDSRGWAVKYASGPSFGDDERLLSADSLGPAEPIVADNTEDVMDDKSSVMAQQFESMLQQSSKSHKQQMMQQARKPQPAGKTTPDYWFMSSQPAPSDKTQITYRNPTVLPGSEDTEVSADDHGAQEQALLNKLHKQEASSKHTNSKMKVVTPWSEQDHSAPPEPSAKTTNPDILRLASNDDLNVSTLAREANRSKDKLEDDGEVVISLH